MMDILRGKNMDRERRFWKSFINENPSLVDIEVFESRKLKSREAMEKYLGRKLDSREVIHHVNYDTYNNEIDNLFLTDSKGHGKAHGSLNAVRKEMAVYPFNKISRETFQKYVENGRVNFSQKLGIYLIMKRK